MRWQSDKLEASSARFHENKPPGFGDRDTFEQSGSSKFLDIAAIETGFEHVAMNPECFDVENIKLGRFLGQTIYQTVLFGKSDRSSLISLPLASKRFKTPRSKHTEAAVLLAKA
ncbi:hypothetical protein PGT21_032825 [Puccinia graminis f. sp. tritici]|uniref:Uncharacterized protein n=1 Tax=Puccinia graminis f. sp. tritici TaxID=56615 RepID=A0A5B0P4C2_PUCGR|nr:hypothetical protein PGTUg99_005815 [Puccinia graminis f. sp. tritici]KAA1094919.1 hypothetical protein PGT21_032825 [Puccinia graminis f. sp. tritici]